METKSVFRTPPEPNSRWQKAKREWQDVIGNLKAQSHNWRVIALCNALCCLLLIGGLIYQSAKSTVTPYVIEVDSSTGLARNIGPVKAQSYTPKEVEVKYFLSQFITNIRSVPLDAIVYKRNWVTAYKMMRQAAAAKMSAINNTENTISLLGKETVQPKILSLVPISKNSYQARWVEESYTLSGGEKASVIWNGVFTFEFGQPENEEELAVNPLGIYILDFSYSKEAATKKTERGVEAQ